MQFKLLLALHQLKSDEAIQKSPRNSGYYKQANLAAFHELSPELMDEFNALLLLEHVHLLYEKNDKIFWSLGTCFKEDSSNSVITFLKTPNKSNFLNLLLVAEQLDKQYQEQHGSLTTLFAESLMTCLSTVALLFQCFLGIVGIPLEGLAMLFVYPRDNTEIPSFCRYSSWLLDAIDNILEHADAVEDAYINLAYDKARKTANNFFDFFQEAIDGNPTQDIELLAL